MISSGQSALALTAATIWIVLLAFVALQYRRQRQLARELERLKTLLSEVTEREGHTSSRPSAGDEENEKSDNHRS